MDKLRIIGALFLMFLLFMPLAVAEYSVTPTIWNINLYHYNSFERTVPLTIQNTEDRTLDLYIHLVEPNFVEEGFEPLPKDCWEWISLQEKNVTLEAQESVTYNVVVRVPKDSEYLNKKYEFWWLAEDVTEFKTIRVDMHTRWRVETPIDFVIEKQETEESNMVVFQMIGLIIIGVAVLTFLFRRRQKNEKQT